MKKVLFLLLAVVTMSCFVACSKDDDESRDKTEDPQDEQITDDPEENGEDEYVVYMLPKTTPIDLTEEQKACVDKMNTFSLNLFKTLASVGLCDGSRFVSPVSVASLLGMLNNGAKGQTSDEISGLLGLTPQDKELLNTFFATLMEAAPLADPSVTLKNASFIAANANMGLQLDNRFVQAAADNYSAESFTLDFSQPSSLTAINDWSSVHTDGMVPQIIDGLSDDVVLVLMNAVCLKATWTEKFDAADTRQEAFSVSDGTTVQLPLMHRKGVARYASNDLYSTLCLPYGSGDKWSMMVLLPQEGKTVADIVKTLDAWSWDVNTKMMKPTQVDIKIPRFGLQSKTDLIKPLTLMGAPSMFSSVSADLTGILSNSPAELYVSLMEQKAAITVDETGTEAAATTVAELELKSATPDMFPAADFHATRPFLFLIQESSSGATFFVGTYAGR